MIHFLSTHFIIYKSDSLPRNRTICSILEASLHTNSSASVRREWRVKPVGGPLQKMMTEQKAMCQVDGRHTQGGCEAQHAACSLCWCWQHKYTAAAHGSTGVQNCVSRRNHYVLASRCLTDADILFGCCCCCHQTVAS